MGTFGFLQRFNSILLRQSFIDLLIDLNLVVNDKVGEPVDLLVDSICHKKRIFFNFIKVFLIIFDVIFYKNFLYNFH